MTRNNLSVFVFHILFNLIVGLCIYPLGEMKLLFEIFISITACIIYCIFGYLYDLDYFKSRIKNFLSVSSILVCGILIWIICANNDQGNSMEYLIWLVYISFYASISRSSQIIIENISQNEFPYIPPDSLILITVIPTLFIWIGHELKNVIKKV